MGTDALSASRKTAKGVLWVQNISQAIYFTGTVVLKGYSGAVQNVMSILRNLLAISGKSSKVLEWGLTVLGVVLVNSQNGYHVAEASSFLFSVINGAAGGLGFTLSIVLFASVRERLDKTDSRVPECFKGFPITLISAGLLALAFMGFSGLSIF